MLVRDVIRATAQAGGMSVPALLSQDRTRDVARLRQTGILVASRLTPASWPALGQYWGGRDHTTALHAARRVDQRIADADPLTLAWVASILALLDVPALPSQRPERARRANYRPDRRIASLRRAESHLRDLRANFAAPVGAAR